MQELARGWKDDPDTLPVAEGPGGPRSERVGTAVRRCRSWHGAGRTHPDTLPLLKEWAARDESESVRQAAVQELARGWKDRCRHPAVAEGLGGPR